MSNTLIFEKIDTFSVLKLFFRFRDADVYYFDSTVLSLKFLSFLRRTGLIKLEITKIDFHFSKLKKKTGESIYHRVITKELTDICSKIKEEIFRRNSFVKESLPLITDDIDKVLVFFVKTVYPDIKKILVFVNVISLYVDSGKIKRGQYLEFIIGKRPFIEVFREYAKEKNIKVSFHRFNFNKMLEELRFIVFYLFAAPLKNYLKKILKRERYRKFIKKDEKIMIGTLYTGREASLDTKKRSEFFWLPKSSIPAERFLICFPYIGKDLVLNKEIVDEYSRYGVECVALSESAADSFDIPVWYSTSLHFRALIRLNLSAFGFFVKELLSGNSNILFYAGNIFKFNYEYSFWFNLFKSLNVKIAINSPDYEISSIPMHIAMKNSGGVSLSYQVADFDSPSLGYSSCTDVFFSFGHYYRELLKGSGFFADIMVFCGYLTDYVFEEVRENALRLKKVLSEKGADFTVSYFDEVSSDSRMGNIENETSAGVYKRLFEKILNDKKFGLICKPKKPKTLRQRISSISNLMDRALDTGRCVFLDKGTYISECYVSEAAQASDLTIGLLIGGTTVFESFLSGVPSFYLDLEGLYSSEKHKAGKDIFVFDNLEKLFDRMADFRDKRDIAGELKKLEKIMEGKDSFRDGKASERMTGYAGSLLNSFDKGEDREKAINNANRLYSEVWGEDNVIECRNRG